MAYDHDAIIRAQYQQLGEDRARALADLESARINESQWDTMDAANRVIEADAKLNALGNIANRYIASHAQASRANKIGLNEDEIAVAHGISGGDSRLTNDQRERIYVENREKLRYMRQTGMYDDTQGKVFK